MAKYLKEMSQQSVVVFGKARTHDKTAKLVHWLPNVLEVIILGLIISAKACCLRG
ncbi:hypothetical protein WKK05_12065 [Nostoc sp. UHCC 0302]|uniref:hypothetical protein n=1 Tax=Nostoc sp. UHCC 0302 TaxID=3134896 RepID=UPI00311CAAA3